MTLVSRIKSNLDFVFLAAIPAVAPAAQVVVRQGGEVVFERADGRLEPDGDCLTRLDTLFDLASVTKLFAVTAWMTLMEQGLVSLDQPVGSVLPEFVGRRPIQPYEDPLQPGKWVEVSQAQDQVDTAQVTFRHLLTHTAGLPAWRPLYRQADAAAARRMALETFFSYRPGERIVYSDIGLILAGLAIEALTGQSLDVVISQRVLDPLGLTHTGYRPDSQENAAPTEFCAWRGRRIQGEVHDENAYRLGGVSAHAGLFSTAADVAAFGQMFLTEDDSLLRRDTRAEMVRCQAEWNDTRRGLGFALWSPDPEASSNPFSPQAFGHTGFTGTSLWVDPPRQLVVALLTNEVYYGRQNRHILQLRVDAHRAIVRAIDGVEL